VAHEKSAIGARRSGTIRLVMTAMFIALEGTDGSGLSTQTERLAAWFRTAGRPVHATKEPSGGPAGMAHLLGPNGGFLFSYPVAAATAGWIVRVMRPITTRFRSALVAATVATLPIFLLGAGWLACYAHHSVAATWSLAVTPFIPGEIVKITAAAGIFSSLQRWRQSRIGLFQTFPSPACLTNALPRKFLLLLQFPDAFENGGTRHTRHLIHRRQTPASPS